MKVTVEWANNTLETQSLKAALNSPRYVDPARKRILQRNSRRRRIKTPGQSVVLRGEVGSPSGKRSSRLETPSLRWKFDDDSRNSKKKSSPRTGRRATAVLSARKLAAGLWRVNWPEFQENGGPTFGLQCGSHHGGFLKREHYKNHLATGKDLVHSPCLASLRKKCEPSFQFPNASMEGVTKWDPVGGEILDESTQMFGESKKVFHRQRVGTDPVMSTLQTELQQATVRIGELEMERRSSRKKLEQFLQKLSEERTAWRRKEHEKIRAIIDDVKSDLSREKKNRQKLEMINSKLVNQLSDVKLSAKRYRQEYEKERAEREMVEEVCDELAKEIGDDRDEVEAVKRESIRLQQEVEEERKMLQMAEVWREERVQMKLVDAKVMVEDKYSQLNKLVDTLRVFLDSRSKISNTEELEKAEFLWQAATSVDMQDIRELTYEPPKSGDIFSVFEEMNFGESNEKESEQCVGYSPASHTSKIHTVSPEVKMLDKDSARVLSNVYMVRSGELEQDTSEWETVSHAEDQDSSYSPDGSDPSISNNYRVSNVSRNGTELDSRGEGTPIFEISEVGSIPARNSKKVPAISRLWRSFPANDVNFKNLSVEEEGRLSNEVDMSPDHALDKNRPNPHNLAGRWSSSDRGNLPASRGMKGCIDWSRNMQKSSLKARLLEARMESQKVQLRQVLKQKF